MFQNLPKHFQRLSKRLAAPGPSITTMKSLAKMSRQIEAILTTLVTKSSELLHDENLISQRKTLRKIVKILKALLSSEVLASYFDTSSPEEEENKAPREVLHLLNEANNLIGVIYRISLEKIDVADDDIPKLTRNLYSAVKNLNHLL